jgi:hypothetical protein
VIRVSATMVDGSATKQWPTTSGVHKDSVPDGFVCPALTRKGELKGKCGPCRACWKAEVSHTSYHLH